MIWEAMVKEFQRHKLRTVLTMLGVTIGIFLVISISSVSEGIMSYVNEKVSMTSGLVTVVDKEAGFMVKMSRIDEDIIEEIESISGVEKVAPILFVDIPGVGSIVGTTPDSDDVLGRSKIEIEEGREFEEGKNELLLGHKYAESHDSTIGDVMKINGTEFEVVGILEESGDNDIDNVITTYIKDLQEATGKDGVVSVIMIKPEIPQDAENIEEEINDNFDDVRAATDKSIMNSANRMLSQLNVMTFALGSIAALISGIVIMNVMFISVYERRREIGVMKAVGATNKQILFQILAESIAISLLGASVGLVLSFCGTAYLNMILLQPIALVTPRLIFVGIFFAAFIGAVSGILPARQAARLNPIEALRYE